MDFSSKQQSIYCIGDSHIEHIVKACGGGLLSPGSSARGLGNLNSVSGVNRLIIDTTNNTKYKGYLFLFGKVDIDFILNYKYNIENKTEFEEYLNESVERYIKFVKNLNITNVIICEITISHLSDESLLKSLNSISIYDGLNNNKVVPQIEYTKVIPLEQRDRCTIFFNKQLKKLCEINKFKFVEINKYFKDGIPEKYISPNDHHLNANVANLYIDELNKGIHSAEVFADSAD